MTLEKLKKISFFLLGITLLGLIYVTKLAVEEVSSQHSKSVTFTKYNPIIRIAETNNAKSNFCSAFVVSDTYAITAGHCVEFSEQMLEERPEEIKQLRSKLIRASSELAELQIGCPPYQMECSVLIQQISAFIREIQIKLDYLKKAEASKYDIYDVNNQKVTTAIAVKMSTLAPKSPDWAILSGDFKQFDKIQLSDMKDLQPDLKFQACGYADGKYPYVCTIFITKSNAGFLYKGAGYVAPGMSGGPILDSKNNAIGIITSVDDNSVYITPTIGIFNITP